MIVSEIPLWGAALVACLVVVAMMALAFIDRKMLRRMLVMPMLYMVMLVGGGPALDGLIVILLLIGAAFVANVLAGVTALLAVRHAYHTVAN